MRPEREPVGEGTPGRRMLAWREPVFAALPPPDDWSPRAGSEIFDAPASRAILRRLCEGDPLGIERLCGHRVETEALLVDMPELFLTALARVAHDARGYAKGQDLGAWLDVRIRRALRDELERDVVEENAGLLLSEPYQTRCMFLAESLGIEPALGRLACIAFNALPIAERRVFWAVKIDRKTIRRHVAEGHGPPDLAHSRLNYAVELILRTARPEGPSPSEAPS